ncbi:MAG: hypothetical protein LKE46_01805 [Clostridium sp.]|jgi:kynurenine formamidase|uniref:hypothetical protein n=1 Tax=Clostridium sp. TaxID=1506 RepID=UPI0025C10C2B|nr:hypothetical protein [Clostridium sp.]MCH3962985.1 hypothetical protein [Clostridium sp.]MCI1800194.1 hypothetical protein [Clostridium sp.]MCI2202064.1 hypothetical protein [Clostridium sp.]
MDTRELFSKRKLTDDELIRAAVKVLKVETKDVLIVNEVNDWLKRDKQSVVFEYTGFLDKEDTDDYIGYYYYSIYFYKDKFLGKLKQLEKEFNTEVIVTI